MDADPEVVSDFYVYVHKDPKTGEPFYVGKGRGKRAYDRGSRHQDWTRHVETMGGDFEVEIVEKGLLERDAYFIEAKLIGEIGKRNDGTGPLVNWTDGGEDELGLIGFVVEIPGQEEAYEKTQCRILRGSERDQFGQKLLAEIDSLLEAIRGMFGEDSEDDEFLYIECVIYSLREEAHSFSKRRLSCKDISWALGNAIEELGWQVEDDEFSCHEVSVFVHRAHERLSELRSGILPG